MTWQSAEYPHFGRVRAHFEKFWLRTFLYLRNRKRTVFLLSYTNTSGSLGEREMLWEHEPQAGVSTAFSSSPKLLRVCITR